MRFIDISGRKFGRLTVIKMLEERRHKQIQWLCQCDCGESTVVTASKLKTGHTKSCGCLHYDVVSESNSTHRMSKTSIYRIWSLMKDRCQNKRSPAYKHYGGRGVLVCERWQKFDHFYEDMGERPEGLTLDRIDNDGNYEPGNCRWATAKQQANNHRGNRLLSFGGKSQNMKRWAKEIGMNYRTLSNRLYLGWSVERALTTPVRYRPPR